MSKERATIGTDGRTLPVLPPERDERVWTKMVRVMFCTPGFMAILPFMLYQLAGFGTLNFVVAKPVNWAINIVIFGLIVAAYLANRQGNYGLEKAVVSALVVGAGAVVAYGVFKLKAMQVEYDTYRPTKEPK